MLSLIHILVVSPEDTVVSCSNGQKTLQTLNFYEKTVHGKKMGWWYPNPYSSQDPDVYKRQGILSHDFFVAAICPCHL